MIVSPGYIYRFEYHGSTRTVVITRTNIGDSLAPNDVVGFGGVELESSKYKNYSSDKCRNIRNAVYDAFEIPKPFNNKKQKYVSFLAESLENVQWALVNPYFSDEIIVVYNEEEIFDGVILTNPDGEELRLGRIYNPTSGYEAVVNVDNKRNEYASAAALLEAIAEHMQEA